jgi:hypothetical protein
MLESDMKQPCCLHQPYTKRTTPKNARNLKNQVANGNRNNWKLFSIRKWDLPKTAENVLSKLI